LKVRRQVEQALPARAAFEILAIREAAAASLDEGIEQSAQQGRADAKFQQYRTAKKWDTDRGLKAVRVHGHWYDHRSQPTMKGVRPVGRQSKPPAIFPHTQDANANRSYKAYDDDAGDHASCAELIASHP
jgi:hypothetical protein